jgi:hypothetical protein
MQHGHWIFFSFAALCFFLFEEEEEEDPLEPTFRLWYRRPLV